MADPYGDGKGPSLKSQSQNQQPRPGPRLKPAIEMEDLINLLHGSDPVRVELTRLENELQCMPTSSSPLCLLLRSHLPT
jgi:hypothetical protein